MLSVRVLARHVQKILGSIPSPPPSKQQQSLEPAGKEENTSVSPIPDLHNTGDFSVPSHFLPGAEYAPNIHPSKASLEQLKWRIPGRLEILLSASHRLGMSVLS